MPISPTSLHDASPSTSSTAHVQVLAVGPWQEQEFRLAKTSINETATWQTASDVSQAGEWLEAGESTPELILLAQPLPDRYSQKHIGRLQALAPLARIVVVAGSWCEGGMRTGTQLTGVLRLYWHELALWWQLAQAQVEAGLCPPWSLPLDNPQAGRSMPHCNAKQPAFAEPVAIHAKDFAVYESLSAALKPMGIATLWNQPTRQVDSTQKVSAGIWDGSQLDQEELEQLTSFCSQLRSHNAAVVVLLDYPRVEHLAQAKAAGATTVLGKPYIVDELVLALIANR